MLRADFRNLLLTSLLFDACIVYALWYSGGFQNSDRFNHLSSLFELRRGKRKDTNEVVDGINGIIATEGTDL